MNKSFNDVINSIADDIQMMMEVASEVEKESAGGRTDSAKAPRSVVAETLRNNFSERHRTKRKIKSPRISDIMQWAQERGLSTDNQNIELINRFLSLDAHSGQPILAVIDKEIERMEDRWADSIYDAMVKELEKFFK